MRSILFYSLFVIALRSNLSAQILTNQEVFNMQPGDAILYNVVEVITTDDLPPTPSVFVRTFLRRDSVLFKQINIALQQVSYTLRRKRYYDGLPESDSTLTVTYPFDANPVSCTFHPSTSTLLDTLPLTGQPGNIPATGFSLSGLDTVQGYSTARMVYAKGLGGPFLLESYIQTIGSITISAYIQYRKAGDTLQTISFASPLAIDLSVKHEGPYPNPFSTFLKLPSSSCGSRFQVVNQQGRVVDEGIVTTPEWRFGKSLVPGLYNFILYHPGGSKSVWRLVKNE